MKKSILSLLILSALVSCKTREDIQREKLVSDMNMQMQDSQKLSADFTVRLQALEERLSNVTGKVEEGQHETKQTLDTRLKGLEEKMNLLETTQKTQAETIEKLEKMSQEQSDYIKDVLQGLKKISGGDKKSKKSLSPYQEAMDNYGKGKYKAAKDQLLVLLEGKKVKGGQLARVIHNLGMISYMDKENDKALAYFSRLFTEFPDTGYNKNGLLFLARTFKRLNKKEEAKQTLQELMKRFPKAKQVSAAKKMLESL